MCVGLQVQEYFRPRGKKQTLNVVNLDSYRLGGRFGSSKCTHAIRGQISPNTRRGLVHTTFRARSPRKQPLQSSKLQARP